MKTLTLGQKFHYPAQNSFKLLSVCTKYKLLVSRFLLSLLSQTLLTSSFLHPPKNSGSKSRRFIPMSKILKPVLNECVTPVTCYWSLSLIVRGEEELTLVFKVIHLFLLFKLNILKGLCIYQ